MKTIASQPYNYRLIYDNNIYTLFVVCGSSAAMYEKEINLSQLDVRKISTSDDYLEQLLQKIRRQ